MENRLVTEDGTKILTVEEHNRFFLCIPDSMKSIFEINLITGLKYVELQQLYDYPHWYHKKSNRIIFPKETQKDSIQKILIVPPIFPRVFSHFINNKKPPYRSSWNKDLARWSLKADITPKVGLKTPRKTIEIWMLKAGFSLDQIHLRLGYNPIVSIKQYQNIHFTSDEINDIDKKLIKWKILKEKYGKYTCYDESYEFY